MQVRRSFQAAKRVIVLMGLLTMTFPASAAQAGWLDRIKDIYQLPDNVDQIKKEYESTKQQLEEQKDKLAEAIKQSQETEQRLLEQNRQLQGENELLQQRLKAIEQATKDKEKRNRSMTYIIVTAAALLVFYFLFGRIFRFVVWRRQKVKTAVVERGRQ